MGSCDWLLYCSYLYGVFGLFNKFFRDKSKVEYPYKKILLLQVFLTVAAYVIAECAVMLKIIVSLLFVVVVLLLLKKRKDNK